MAGKAIIALVAALAVSGAAIAEDQPPEVLTRTQEWVVSSDQNGCHLSAEFGSGDAQVTAQFTRYQPGDAFDLMLSGKRFLNTPGTPNILDYRFATLDFGMTGTAPFRRVAGRSDIADPLPALGFSGLRLDGWTPPANRQSQPPIIWRPDPSTPERQVPDPISLIRLLAVEKAPAPPPAPDITPAQEASVTGLTLSFSSGPPFRLVFGSLAQPFARMRACMDNQVRNWGYNTETIRTLSRPLQPVIPEQSWVSSDDYPEDARRAGNSGVIRFRLDVDAQGKVTGCHNMTPISPENNLGEATCRLLSARASFIPALDAQGHPTKALYFGRVRWVHVAP